MLLWHVTGEHLAKQAAREGLDPSRAVGRIKAVWLAKPGKLGWAIVHVAKWHRWRLQDLALLRVDVPRSWLVRRRKGVWTCYRLIPPERIMVVEWPFLNT